MYTCITDFLCCIAETNIVKKLYFNKHFKKWNYKKKVSWGFGLQILAKGMYTIAKSLGLKLREM